MISTDMLSLQAAHTSFHALRELFTACETKYLPRNNNDLALDSHPMDVKHFTTTKDLIEKLTADEATRVLKLYDLFAGGQDDWPQSPIGSPKEGFFKRFEKNTQDYIEPLKKGFDGILPEYEYEEVPVMRRYELRDDKGKVIFENGQPKMSDRVPVYDSITKEPVTTKIIKKNADGKPSIKRHGIRSNHFWDFLVNAAPTPISRFLSHTRVIITNPQNFWNRWFINQVWVRSFFVSFRGIPRFINNTLNIFFQLGPSTLARRLLNLISRHNRGTGRGIFTNGMITARQNLTNLHRDLVADGLVIMPSISNLSPQGKQILYAMLEANGVFTHSHNNMDFSSLPYETRIFLTARMYDDKLNPKVMHHAIENHLAELRVTQRGLMLSKPLTRNKNGAQFFNFFDFLQSVYSKPLTEMCNHVEDTFGKLNSENEGLAYQYATELSMLSSRKGFMETWSRLYENMMCFDAAVLRPIINPIDRQSRNFRQEYGNLLWRDNDTTANFFTDVLQRMTYVSEEIEALGTNAYNAKNMQHSTRTTLDQLQTFIPGTDLGKAEADVRRADFLGINVLYRALQTFTGLYQLARSNSNQPHYFVECEKLFNKIDTTCAGIVQLCGNLEKYTITPNLQRELNGINGLGLKTDSPPPRWDETMAAIARHTNGLRDQLRNLNPNVSLVDTKASVIDWLTDTTFGFEPPVISKNITFKTGEQWNSYNGYQIKIDWEKEEIVTDSNGKVALEYVELTSDQMQEQFHNLQRLGSTTLRKMFNAANMNNYIDRFFNEPDTSFELGVNPLIHKDVMHYAVEPDLPITGKKLGFAFSRKQSVYTAYEGYSIIFDHGQISEAAIHSGIPPFKKTASGRFAVEYVNNSAKEQQYKFEAMAERIANIWRKDTLEAAAGAINTFGNATELSAARLNAMARALEQKYSWYTDTPIVPSARISSHRITVAAPVSSLVPVNGTTNRVTVSHFSGAASNVPYSMHKGGTLAHRGVAECLARGHELLRNTREGLTNIALLADHPYTPHTSTGEPEKTQIIQDNRFNFRGGIDYTPFNTTELASDFAREVLLRRQRENTS
jgi:hypothetical protein